MHRPNTSKNSGIVDTVVSHLAFIILPDSQTMSQRAPNSRLWCAIVVLLCAHNAFESMSEKLPPRLFGLPNGAHASARFNLGTYLFKLCFCLRFVVGITIWMPFHGQLLVGRFNLVRRRIL